GVVSAVVTAAALLAAAITGVALRWPPAGAIAAAICLAIAAFAAWRTAQATAIVQRAVKSIATEQGMVSMKPVPARVPLLSPSMLRVYGLRTAALFLITILGVGAGSFMLREAATAQVFGARKGYGGDNGPAMQAALNNPGGVAVSPSGDVFVADSDNQ